MVNNEAKDEDELGEETFNYNSLIILAILFQTVWEKKLIYKYCEEVLFI